MQLNVEYFVFVIYWLLIFYNVFAGFASIFVVIDIFLYKKGYT